jgi:hypothetical protein
MENTPPVDLAENIQFTGKATCIIDTSPWGPIRFNINDKELVIEIVRTLLEHSGNITQIDGYTDDERTVLDNLLST